MKHLSNIENNKSTDLTVPAFDHKEPEDEDCELPEVPIFSNFSKHLWQSHAKLGSVQSLKRARKNTDKPENAK
jgi:hypothetical protein